MQIAGRGGTLWRRAMHTERAGTAGLRGLVPQAHLAFLQGWRRCGKVWGW